jgi:hypothetical protein
VASISYSRLFACGKAALNTPAIYVLGTVNGVKDGVFQPDDNGKTWVRIDTPAYRMGMELNRVAADHVTTAKYL